MNFRPEVELVVNGQKIIFLCDSGACKTVLRDSVPSLTTSMDSILVRSANGQLQRKIISNNLHFRDSKNNKDIYAPVVISPKCPVNLLGRDLMSRLGISLVPVRGGMQAIFASITAKDAYDKSQLNYYYTLDVINQQTAQGLLQKVMYHMTAAEDVMTPDQLHVTMRYDSKGMIDNEYWTLLNNLERQDVQLQCVYTDYESLAVIKVLLSVGAQNLYKIPSKPHMSIAKPCRMKWQMLAGVVEQAETTYDWVPTGTPGQCYSASLKLYRNEMLQLIEVQPALHQDKVMSV